MRSNTMEREPNNITTSSNSTKNKTQYAQKFINNT